MPSKKNTEAPAAKIARNPSDKTARAMYDAVVAQEGTVGGHPARIALYGTKYAALEVGGEGAWAVDHDTAFGGVRAIETLRSSFDEVLVLGGDMREIQLTAGNVAVVEPEIVEVVDADPVVVELDPVDFAKAEANIAAMLPAPVVAAEPVLTTLDEVRAAHEAETRGACRASVLRALRVRAGEIALGVVAGGKGEKANQPAVKADGKWATWATAQAALLTADVPERDVTFAELATAGFAGSVTKYAAAWSPKSSTAGRALAAVGLRASLHKECVTISRE
jgi:hypothetical protein